MTDLEKRLRDTVWRLLGEARCPDGFPEANNEERASYLTPRLVRALKAAIDKRERQVDDALGGLMFSHGICITPEWREKTRAEAFDAFVGELTHD